MQSNAFFSCYGSDGTTRGHRWAHCTGTTSMRSLQARNWSTVFLTYITYASRGERSRLGGRRLARRPRFGIKPPRHDAHQVRGVYACVRYVGYPNKHPLVASARHSERPPFCRSLHYSYVSSLVAIPPTGKYTIWKLSWPAVENPPEWIIQNAGKNQCPARNADRLGCPWRREWAICRAKPESSARSWGSTSIIVVA